MLKEFKEFSLKGNMMDLAVEVRVGSKTNRLISTKFI